MTSLRQTRDVYGPATTGGVITRTRRAPVRKLSAPRERTLTELGLRDTRFEPIEQTPHHMIASFECARLVCAFHDVDLTRDCGD